MQAIIFSAGLGTRFKPWTDSHPKALAIVNGKSLLQRNIEYLRQYGIKDIIINVHHFADQVDAAIVENDGWGSNILVSDEREELLETGGGLLKAKDLFVPGESFITCNADFLTNLNIHKLINYHNEKKALLTFGVTSRKSSRLLLFNKDYRLVGWKNSNTGETKITIPDEPIAYELAYSCVVVCDYKIFNLMERYGFSGKFSLIDVYLKLTPGHLIMGYNHTGDKLVDVGKPESVKVAEALFE